MLNKKVNKKELLNIHNTALRIVGELKSKEDELIRVLQQIDKNKVHRFCGYNSLFQYALKALLLTESQAYDYIRVARKALEIPELQQDLDDRTLSESKARKIIPIADESSYREWSLKAQSMSKRELEREIAGRDPRRATREHFRYLGTDLIQMEAQMEAPIGDKTFKKIQRAQEVLSQKLRKHVKLNEAISYSLDEFLKKHDPMEKERRLRQRAKAKKAEEKKRIIIPNSPPKNQVNRVNKENKANQGTQNKPEHTNQKIRALIKMVPQKHSEKNRTTNPQLNQQTNLGPGPKNRRALSTGLKHQVLKGDNYACQWKRKADPEICGSRHFLEIHHKVPVSSGGLNTNKNLVTLCSGHHKAHHEFS